MEDVQQRERIKDWFFNQFKAHPNQLIHRRYMPPRGLISRSFLAEFYSLGTSLQALENDGKLAMPWLQFYLWRVGERSEAFRKERLDSGNQKLDFGRQILIDIFARSSSKATDPILTLAYQNGRDLRGKQAQLERKRKATTLSGSFFEGDSEDEYRG